MAALVALAVSLVSTLALAAPAQFTITKEIMPGTEAGQVILDPDRTT